MPPKGTIEKDEDLREAASREVEEEVGIRISPSLLKEPSKIEYRSLSGDLYKVVYVFVHKIDSLSQIGLVDEVVNINNLQKEEIDDAKFMTISELEKKAHPRYIKTLERIIRENYSEV